MMILVVKTCDGDVYFRGNRRAAKEKAITLATEQILYNDLTRYCDEDRKLVFEVKPKELYATLLELGVIKEEALEE